MILTLISNKQKTGVVKNQIIQIYSAKVPLRARLKDLMRKLIEKLRELERERKIKLRQKVYKNRMKKKKL